MRVKIEFFNTEWRGNFSLIIHVGSIEKLRFGMVLKDIASNWILKITSVICQMACLVTRITMAILENYYVSSIVSLQLTQDIINVERSMVRIWGNLNRMIWLVEILKIFHYDFSLNRFDFSLNRFDFFFELLFTNFTDDVLGLLIALAFRSYCRCN